MGATAILIDRWRRETARCLASMLSDRLTLQTAAVLALAALGLIDLHAYTMLSLRDGGISAWTVDPDWLRLDRDRSISETLEYLLTLGAALLAGRAWQLTREPIYFAAAAVFVVMVLDNALMLHEWLALTLVEHGWLPAVLGQEHAHARGELVFFAVVGSLLVGATTLGFLRSGLRHRVRGILLLSPVAVAVAFGIGVDYFKCFADGPSWLGYGLTMVEDGGELLAIVLLMVVALGVVRGLPAPSRTIDPDAARSYPAGAMALEGAGALTVRRGPGRR